MLKRYPEALEDFERAVAIDLDFARSWGGLGIARAKLGHHSEAIEAYTRALDLEPDSAETHLYLGSSYLAIGERDRAVAEYEFLKERDERAASMLLDLISEQD